MAGFGARHFKQKRNKSSAEAGSVEVDAAGQSPLDDVDAVLDDFDAGGSHFRAEDAPARGQGGASGARAAAGAGATPAPGAAPGVGAAPAPGTAPAGSPSETMQFVMAAQQGAKRATPSSAEAQRAAGASSGLGAHSIGAHSQGARGGQGQGQQARSTGQGQGQQARSTGQDPQGQGQGGELDALPVATPTVRPQPVKVGGAHLRQRGTQPMVEPLHAKPAHESTAEAETEPKARRRRGVLSTLLIVVGVALLVVAGGILAKALLGYHEAATIYDDLEQYAVSDEEGDDIPSVDFEALAAINPDIVGWIYIPGTQINYPVVQTDDNSTYLTKLFDDTSNTCGTIFMDYEDTAPGMVDQQTTIYGHHMNDGSMFKFIDNTLDQDDFDTVEVVYYITADAVYVLKPLCTTEVDETYLSVRQTDFGSEAELQSYLEDMLEQASAQASDAEERLASAEQVLSLVTCAGEVLPRTTRAVMICTIEEIITTE